MIEEARELLQMVEQQDTALAANTLELDTSTYTDSELFEREKNTFFRGYPQLVGPSCLLPNPGDYFAFDDTGIPLLLVRNRAGQVNGFLNYCSHRGAPLAEGLGTRRGGLTCPYHAWTYDFDGQLRGVPYEEKGFCGLDKADRGLKQVQVAEKNGLLFVMPNSSRTFDVDELLSGLGERVETFDIARHHHFGTKKMHVAMNWKLNMDTFHEFYHFQALHPDTIATTAHNNIGLYAQYGRNHVLSSPNTTIEQLSQLPEDQWDPRAHLSFVHYFFPNAVMFVVADHFQTFRLYPVDESSSVVYHSMYLPELPADEEQKQFFDEYFQMINDVVVNEDYALGQEIQRGLSSGINRKVIIGRNEPGVQNMHLQIEDALRTGTVGSTIKVA